MDKVREGLSKAWEFVKTKWIALDKKIRIIIIAVAAVLIVSLIILLIINSAVRYTVLYADASPEEMQEIVSVLQTELGETEVRVSGNDILVPAEKEETLRAQLSVKGYPKATFNYDIWDEGTGLFSTDSDKRVKQIQQLQENLRATLSSFDGVQSALVILSIPQADKNVISGKKEEAGASVVLQLSHSLTAETVDGIYHLIRTAVPDLKEENISVTDGYGNLLTSENIEALLADQEDETTLYYKRLNFQKEISSILYEKLDKLFDGAFPDYRVAVDVQLNYDAQVEQIKEYTPSVDEEGNRGGMVQNEKYVSAGGGNADEGGIVGTTIDADISPDYPTLRIGEGDEFYYEAQREINYLVNEAIKQVEKDGYSYDNISASVLVDAPSEDVSQADAEDWQRLIATAIGTSTDKVTFKATSFQLDKTDGDDESTVIMGGTRNPFVYIIIALGVILIVLLILALTAAGSGRKRARTRRAAAAAGAGAPEGTSPDYDEEEDMRKDVSRRGSGDEYDFELQSLTEGEDEGSRDALLKKEIRDFSTQNPEIVAQLIRTWMRGDE